MTAYVIGAGLAGLSAAVALAGKGMGDGGAHSLGRTCDQHDTVFECKFHGGYPR